MKDIEDNVGKWVFITGSNKIGEDCWKRNFPQDWFGKIISQAKNRLTDGIVYTVRCYRPKEKTKDKEQRHPHIKTTIKYLKFI